MDASGTRPVLPEGIEGVIGVLWYQAVVVGEIVIPYPDREERPFPIGSMGWFRFTGPHGWGSFQGGGRSVALMALRGESDMIELRGDPVRVTYHLSPHYFD